MYHVADHEHACSGVQYVFQGPSNTANLVSGDVPTCKVSSTLDAWINASYGISGNQCMSLVNVLELAALSVCPWPSAHLS